MECAYCVAIVLICLNIILILVVGSLKLVAKFFIDGIFVVVLALATKNMSGAMFHPLVVMVLMSNWYFLVFSFKGFYHKSCIAIYTLYELHYEFWVGVGVF